MIRILIFCITILCLPLYLHSLGAIYGIINSTFKEKNLFNFSIITEDLVGIILHCIDKQGNEFSIEVIKHNRFNNIRVKRLETFKDITLKELCGCDPCTNAKIDFFIEISLANNRVSCNNRYNSIVSVYAEDLNPKGNISIPKELLNAGKSMMIILGNKGPYTNDRNEQILPQKIQMKACLDEFFFNGERIKFTETGQRMKSNCHRKCVNDICHGGECVERYSNVSCDCSMTSLNGRYCNNSLYSYNRETSNSYINKNIVKEMYLKMSWNNSMDRRHCLLEITDNHQYVTIMTNGGSLVLRMNNTEKIIFYNNNIGINFINIYYKNNKLLIYKTKNEELLRTDIIWFFKFHLNVGFSDNNGICESFEGSYDFYYDRSRFQRYSYNHMNTTYGNVPLSPKDSQSSNPIQLTTVNIVCIAAVFCICSLLIVVLFVVKLYRSRIVNIDDYINKIVVRNISVEPHKESVSVEVCSYALVNDETEYDMLRENSIYGTVDF